jgi:protein-tyrosine kinase
MKRENLPSVRETFTDQYSLIEQEDFGHRLLEEYRTLYTAAMGRLSREGGIVLGVSSPLPGEGKTTVATNIAGAMAADLEKRVLLTSCAFTSGEPQAQGNQRTHLGLADLIADPDQDLDQLIVRTPLPNLSVLLPGTRPDNPSRLLRSQRMAQALERLRDAFDITIFDMMPMLSASDSQVLAAQMDGVLLVVGLGQSGVDAVQRSVRMLGEGRLVGVAANRAHPLLPRWMLHFLGGGEWGA